MNTAKVKRQLIGVPSDPKKAGQKSRTPANQGSVAKSNSRAGWGGSGSVHSRISQKKQYAVLGIKHPQFANKGGFGNFSPSPSKKGENATTMFSEDLLINHQNTNQPDHERHQMMQTFQVNRTSGYHQDGDSLGLTLEDVNILSEIQKATYLKCFQNKHHLRTPQGEFDNTFQLQNPNTSTGNPIYQRLSTAGGTKSTRAEMKRGLHQSASRIAKQASRTFTAQNNQMNVDIFEAQRAQNSKNQANSRQQVTRLDLNSMKGGDSRNSHLGFARQKNEQQPIYQPGTSNPQSVGTLTPFSPFGQRPARNSQIENSGQQFENENPVNYQQHQLDQIQVAPVPLKNSKLANLARQIDGTLDEKRVFYMTNGLAVRNYFDKREEENGQFSQTVTRQWTRPKNNDSNKLKGSSSVVAGTAGGSAGEGGNAKIRKSINMKQALIKEAVIRKQGVGETLKSQLVKNKEKLAAFYRSDQINDITESQVLLGTQEIELPEGEDVTGGEHTQMVQQVQDPIFKNEAAKSVLKQIKGSKKDKDEIPTLLIAATTQIGKDNEQIGQLKRKFEDNEAMIIQELYQKHFKMNDGVDTQDQPMIPLSTERKTVQQITTNQSDLAENNGVVASGVCNEDVKGPERGQSPDIILRRPAFSSQNTTKAVAKSANLQFKQQEQFCEPAPDPNTYSKPLQDKIKYVQYIPKMAKGTIEDAVNQLYLEKENQVEESSDDEIGKTATAAVEQQKTKKVKVTKPMTNVADFLRAPHQLSNLLQDRASQLCRQSHSHAKRCFKQEETDMAQIQSKAFKYMMLQKPMDEPTGFEPGRLHRASFFPRARIPRELLERIEVSLRFQRQTFIPDKILQGRPMTTGKAKSRFANLNGAKVRDSQFLMPPNYVHEQSNHENNMDEDLNLSAKMAHLSQFEIDQSQNPAVFDHMIDKQRFGINASPIEARHASPLSTPLQAGVDDQNSERHEFLPSFASNSPHSPKKRDFQDSGGNLKETNNELNTVNQSNVQQNHDNQFDNVQGEQLRENNLDLNVGADQNSQAPNSGYPQQQNQQQPFQVVAQQSVNGQEPRVFVILTDNQGQVAESLKMQARENNQFSAQNKPQSATNVDHSQQQLLQQQNPANQNQAQQTPQYKNIKSSNDKQQTRDRIEFYEKSKKLSKKEQESSYMMAARKKSDEGKVPMQLLMRPLKSYLEPDSKHNQRNTQELLKMGLQDKKNPILNPNLTVKGGGAGLQSTILSASAHQAKRKLKASSAWISPFAHRSACLNNQKKNLRLNTCENMERSVNSNHCLSLNSQLKPEKLYSTLKAQIRLKSEAARQMRQQREFLSQNNGGGITNQLQQQEQQMVYFQNQNGQTNNFGNQQQSQASQSPQAVPLFAYALRQQQQSAGHNQNEVVGGMVKPMEIFQQ